MQETLNYQVTYGAQTPAPRPDPDAPLFASEDGRVASLSSQECIFHVTRSGDTHVMTFQVLQAMDQCREFRSLDEHAARIETTIAGLAGKRDDIRRVLEGLVQRELLVADRIFIERLTNTPAIAQQNLRAVFIRACDRPQQLGRLLNSLSTYERDHRAGRRYVVLDDSSLPAHINEQRDLLREFARTTGCKVAYIGSAESAKIAGKLSRALPQAKSALSRALLRDSNASMDRFGGGRSWNMALLLSAGARLAILDDDLCLPLRRPDYARDGLDPNPNAQALARFPANMENALTWGEPVSQDPFELHLQGCGQMLGALSHDQYPLDRRALRGLNLGRLSEFNADSRILATQAGTCGSSRTETGLWLYQLDAESRAEFWHSRDTYQRNVDAQHLCHAVAQARVAAMANFTPFTLDNSRMLPCTNPIGRGEDGLAGALMRYCHPHSVMLELPEAIGHVQEVARKRSDKTLAAYEPRVNHFLRDYVQRQFGAFHAAETAHRMHSMADVLRDLAAASVDDRISHLREYLSYIRADIIDRLHHQIEAVPDAPVYWQADAREIVQTNARALLAKTPPRLGDWAADIDDTGCAAALATELNDFAELCEHWPALWQHAAEQGEKLLSTV
ncbi:MAG: hypothetical protein ABI304_08230 [Rudaea sp.]